jgi:cytoskeleton protein RodZ
MLLAERRRQGLSLGDISRQLKLSVRQVEALERDDFKSFRGAVFVHGFIRNYAKLLRLDAEPLIRAADLTLAPPAVAAEQPEPDANRTTGKPPARNWSAIAAGLVVLVAAAIYFGSRGNDGTTSPPPVVADSGEPSSSSRSPEPNLPPETAAVSVAAQPAAAVPAAAPAGRATLRMIFDQESWVEIKDAQGNTIFGQLTPAGSRRSVSGEPPLTVVVGNAVGVRLTYKDQSVDLAAHTQANVARVTLE